MSEVERETQNDGTRKIVISCDELVQRTHVTEIVELFSELYPHSEIYTIAHKVKAIHGKLEMRKIHSTFLSHKVEHRDDLKRWGFSVPNAAKNLFIPCSVDLIINVSSGLSHGIRKCDKTKMITYFYSDEFMNKKPRGFIQRVFSSFTRSWALKELKKSDKVYFSTESLEKTYGRYTQEHKVMPPSFKLDDFKLFPKDMFGHDFALINAPGIKTTQANNLVALMDELGLKYRFVGPDDHLESLKQSIPDAFLGIKCIGEMAPIYASSQFYIDFSENEFPVSSLACLATGRPVLVSRTPMSEDILKGEGVCFVDPNNSGELASSIKDFMSKANDFEGKKLRAPTAKFNEIRFKSKLKKDIEGMIAN